MTRLPLTICLALAWFFAANALLSVSTAAARGWWCARMRKQARTSQLSTGAALGLRLLPSAAAAFFVAAIFVPAFLAHEPAEGPEPVGWVLLAGAAAALAMGGAGVRRGRVARRRARATAAAWTANATPIVLDGLSGTGIRAFVMEEQFPVVSLVGLWRPRLFIARHVIEALTADELRVAVAHEVAHRRAWDNAKRLFLCASPDLLGWWAVGHGLERQWAAAAECAADRRAVADSRTRGLDLAAALVKVSRLAVGPAPGVSLFSTLHEYGDIAGRVSRLVRPAPDPQPRSIRVRVIVITSAALVVSASLPWIFPAVHALTENCLRLLP